MCPYYMIDLQEPVCNGAVDDEASGAKLRPGWSGDEAPFDHAQILQTEWTERMRSWKVLFRCELVSGRLTGSRENMNS